MGMTRGGGGIEAALRGPTAPPEAMEQQPQQSEPGDGTQQSGYVMPDLGPFECENCTHFEAPNRCNHPEVVADPEVNGNVEAEGCCNFFKSAGQESQAEEHSDSGVSEGEEHGG
jgi:hypothetical protein